MKQKPDANKGKILVGVIYFYLLLPVMIFLFGWCKIWLAIPGAVIIVTSYVLALKKANDLKIPVSFFNRKDIIRIIIVTLIIIVWVTLSGVGGYVWQNGDHVYRNAIFDALVELPWPTYKEIVTADGSQIRPLVYYIGFWLPSAAVGKLLGISAGYCFQLIWVTLGIFLVYLLIGVWRKKIMIWPLVVMIFFSGLDYVGINILNSNKYLPTTLTHMEHWSGSIYQYSSNTTQLFWVFNQAVYAWLVLMFLWNQRSKANLVLVLSTLVLVSPFAFVGLTPIIFCLYFVDLKYNEKKYRIRDCIIELFSFQNLIGGGFVGILSFLYLKSNASVAYTASTGIVANVIQTESKGNAITGNLLYSVLYSISIFILFFLLEVGIYLLLVWYRNRKNFLFYVVTTSLLIIPFIKVGYEADFCMRASIPALFVLMLYIIEALEEEKKGRIRFFILIMLMIGALTPVTEIHRTLSHTWQKIPNKTISMQDIFSGGNFSGNRETFFFQKLARSYSANESIENLRIEVANSSIVSRYIYTPSILSQDDKGRYIASGSIGIAIDAAVDSSLELRVNCGLAEYDAILVDVNGQNAGLITSKNEKLELNRNLFDSHFQNIILTFGYLNERGNFVKDEAPVHIWDITFIAKK